MRMLQRPLAVTFIIVPLAVIGAALALSLIEADPYGRSRFARLGDIGPQYLLARVALRYLLVLVVAIPTHFLFRRVGLKSFVAYIISGAALAATPLLIYYFLAIATVENPQSSFFASYPEEYARLVAQSAGWGVLIAGIYWALAVRDSKS